MMKKNFNPRGGRFGFTLIELLIVIAIILILIAIALPNFIEARMRAQVVHAYGDMKALAEAEEMFFLDHKTYTDDFLHFSDHQPPHNSLTTPIRYIVEYPSDPFQKYRGKVYDFPRYEIGTGNIRISRKTGYPFEGCSPIANPLCTTPSERHPDTADTFMIRSKGPDDLDSGGPSAVYPHPYPEGVSSYQVYSPTNGTFSHGDMYRFGGSIPNLYKVLIGG